MNNSRWQIPNKIVCFLSTRATAEVPEVREHKVYRVLAVRTDAQVNPESPVIR
jgi:hypothetical protein